ncbi:N-acetyltransferase [Clostridium sardiniense]|uniref:N-acetyltransferase n=1 Tax=Clostridium sardiniense TaxID=29369 RepID=A0ABS7L1N5_CLOSR|nr:N-acetyltransferase [Clostridium sardiniense]MBY0756768.1 N-acetyltransferase [Clostridium sardiniense]MDQ0460454.1 putative N-acetyltransferase YhbS [Clostridium sardiniense]
MDIMIREENNKDFNEVYDVVRLAFENAEHTDHNEHNLVNRLRNSDAFIKELSLVVEGDEKIIGHIMITKIKIGEHTSLALAPLSVLPKYHGMGIGRELILEGHKIAKDLGYSSVIILGDPNYYSRFGYVAASKWRIKAPFEVPDENFMAIELIDNGLKDVSGEVIYAKEFFE